MSLRYNNPAVSRSTKSWLLQIATTQTILDIECFQLIAPAVAKVNQVHPGGLIFSLALDLNASEKLAFIAGSAAELFYAACSLTDDIQDGDSDKYMGAVPLSLQINAQAQLISLVAVRLNELAENVPPDLGLPLVMDVYRTLSIMLTGQRVEIARNPWNGAAFETVARLSAGEQFGTYMRFAATAAQKSPECWISLGRALGNALQVIADQESRDERFLALPSEEKQYIVKLFRSELVKTSKQCNNTFINFQVTALLNRWDQCLNVD